MTGVRESRVDDLEAEGLCDGDLSGFERDVTNHLREPGRCCEVNRVDQAKRMLSGEFTGVLKARQVDRDHVKPGPVVAQGGAEVVGRHRVGHHLAHRCE